MNLIKQYYPYLSKDMSELIGYIWPGIMTGLFCSIIFLIICHIFTGRYNLQKTFAFFLFITYASIIIQIAYLSRPPGSRTDVTFGLGDTWGTTLQSHAYVIENVIMFIPFGLIFPMLGKYARYFCIPAAICSSAAIEGMQYISQRGYCQLDDLITNVIGACIGYIIFGLFYFIRATSTVKSL